MLATLKGSAKRFATVLIIIGGGLFAITAPVYAQEGASSQTNQGPAGIGILILLMGIGAIVLVGAVYAAQMAGDRDKESRNSASGDEDE